MDTGEEQAKGKGSTMEKQSHVRHWLVVITCCMLMMCSSGALLNAAGMYYPAISAEFDCLTSQVTIWLTICFIMAAIVLLFLGKLFEKYDARVICSIGVLFAVIGELIFSSARDLTTLYIGAVPVGIGFGIMAFIAAATLINRWFKKRVGFALGVAVAFSGIGGVLFNYIGGYVMTVADWHMGFFVNGILIAAFCLPFTIFAIRSYPSDCGLRMYGETDDEEEEESPALYGISAKKALRSLTFYLCILFVIGGVFGLNCYQFLPKYALTLPVAQGSLTFAATLASSAMIGQMIGKIVLGAIADKSLKASIIISNVCGIIGVLLMGFVGGSIPILLAGGFIFGFFYLALNVISPLLVRAAFGTKDYAIIFSRVSVLNAFISAFAVTILAMVVDFAGFRALFILTMIICVFMTVVALIIVARRFNPDKGVIED